MTITSVIVVYAVIWFLVLFCVLPQRIRTQHEDGKVVPGTSGSAPTDSNIKYKFFVTTVISSVISMIVCLSIIYNFINLDNFNLFEKFGPKG
ncbi:MAG: putative secreted protein [Paracoccaceae bacterium]|jgi:predicted secreted protein